MCTHLCSQACVIAFTSDFVPKMLYKWAYSNDGTLNGYVDFSMSYYASSLLKVEDLDTSAVEYCR